MPRSGEVAEMEVPRASRGAARPGMRGLRRGRLRRFGGGAGPAAGVRPEVRARNLGARDERAQVTRHRPRFFQGQRAPEWGHDGAAAFEDDARQLAIDQFLAELDWGWGECLLAPLKIEGERDHA